jgi:hypothetical protein
MGFPHVLQLSTVIIIPPLGFYTMPRNFYQVQKKTCFLSRYSYSSLFIYLYLMLFAVNKLNIFQTNSSVHGINTRQQSKLHIPSVRLSSIQRGIYYSSVKIFNQLPQYVVKYYTKIHNFKNFLRDYLVQNYFYSIEEFLSAGHNNVDI